MDELDVLNVVGPGGCYSQTCIEGYMEKKELSKELDSIISIPRPLRDLRNRNSKRDL